MKKIKSFYYIYNEDSMELEIRVVDLNDNEYSVATISDVKEEDADRLTQEILIELEYEEE